MYPACTVLWDSDSFPSNCFAISVDRILCLNNLKLILCLKTAWEILLYFHASYNQDSQRGNLKKNFFCAEKSEALIHIGINNFEIDLCHCFEIHIM